MHTPHFVGIVLTALLVQYEHTGISSISYFNATILLPRNMANMVLRIMIVHPLLYIDHDHDENLTSYVLRSPT